MDKFVRFLHKAKFPFLGVIAVMALTACTTGQGTSVNSSTSSQSSSTVTWCITEPQKSKVCYDPVPLYDGQTAYDTFVALDQRENSVTFKSTDYGGDLGNFVTSINGVDSDSANFWKLFTNGTEAQTGISAIKPQDKDILEFRYEAVQ